MPGEAQTAAKKSLWACFGRRMRDGSSLGRSQLGEGCMRESEREKILRGEGGEIWNQVFHGLPAWLEVPGGLC